MEENLDDQSIDNILNPGRIQWDHPTRPGMSAEEPHKGAYSPLFYRF